MRPAGRAVSWRTERLKALRQL